MRHLLLFLLEKVLPIAIRARAVYRRVVRPVKIGVRALVMHEGSVLLVRQHGTACWVLPGGIAGRGESLRAAAMREVHEETGCIVEVERLLGIYSCMCEGMTLHTAVYVCRLRTQATMPLNIEIAEARYWPVAALPATEGAIELRLAEYLADVQCVDEGFEVD